MLTKDDVVFEEDLYANSHVHSQEEALEALVELINTFSVELGIKRLDKVIVKKTDFFDTELGLANYKKYTIVLANSVAFCLADKSARFYQRSLAVLKHELYHFQDYQNLRINVVCKHISETNDDVLDGFRCWTEFFASFSTFEVCEDENLYTSFESVFEKSYSTDKDKKYYTCRLLGYYLHGSHSERCDKLVAKYLSKNALDKAINSFKSVLQSYPQYSTEQLRNIGLAIPEVIDKQEDIATYTPISEKDYWTQLLKKARRS